MGAALVAGMLAAPAAAQATLVYVKNPLKPVVWVANDDGSGARRVAAGATPHASPDGQTISFYRQQKARRYRPELMVAPADGSSAPRRILTAWREQYVFDWSQDSKTIVAVTGPELGKKRLVLIDVASGAQRTIASGFFNGASFAPDGSALVYSKSASENYPPRSDIYSLDLASGKTARLTKDHRSHTPLCGGGQIVFDKLLGAKQRRYGPKNELFLMDSNGGHVRRLTHTNVGPLLLGLTPIQWAHDGAHLLAEFEGQDTSYAVGVNVKTGAQRPIDKAGERGLVGTSLSPDGKTVLGATGGFEPGPGHNVVTIPYDGGRKRVLARNAFEPQWSHPWPQPLASPWPSALGAD